MNDAVKRALDDYDELRKVRAGVLTAVVERVEGPFRGLREPGLLASEFALSDLHAFADVDADEVRFDCGDHRQDTEEAVAARIGGVVVKPVEVEVDVELGKDFDDPFMDQINPQAFPAA